MAVSVVRTSTGTGLPVDLARDCAEARAACWSAVRPESSVGRVVPKGPVGRLLGNVGAGFVAAGAPRSSAAAADAVPVSGADSRSARTTVTVEMVGRIRLFLRV
ncbi:hypothetical protein GCM10010335_49850 [Streptomyces galbus]|nr:hypothetical protein GCM10010335_49850 [Streptomyces galbus]